MEKNYIEEALKRSVIAGFLNDKIPQDALLDNLDTLKKEVVFLDPDFWKYLGITEGWKQEFCNDCGEELGFDEETKVIFCPRCPLIYSDKTAEDKGYLHRWHRFIDHLDTKKDPQDFFKNLLSKK